MRERCRPSISGIDYPGIEGCRAPEGVEDALRQAGTIVVCPSNPFISVGPILAVPGIRDRGFVSPTPLWSQ